MLSPREQLRIGGALAVALVRIEERQGADEALRSDGFFDADGDARTDAEEVLEGVLLNAARSYEERKVEFLGRFYASVAFDDSIGRAYAHVLMQMIERTTFRKLVILAYITDSDRADDRTSLAVDLQEGAVVPSPVIVTEINRLGAEGLLGNQQADGSVVGLSQTWAGGIFAEFFGTVALTDMGEDLTRLAELGGIPSEDKDAVVDAIRGVSQ